MTGILVTQTVGFFLSGPGWWRGVFLVTLGLSAIQLLAGLYMIESPVWLTSNSRHDDARTVASRIWHGKSKSGGAFSYRSFSIGELLLNGNRLTDRDEEEALLRESTATAIPGGPPPASVVQCLRAPELRRPLLIVSLTMLVQQVSGEFNLGFRFYSIYLFPRYQRSHVLFH